ncbi:unnamed protein product, partial [Discosporangium mesarthrocarpum]
CTRGGNGNTPFLRRGSPSCGDSRCCLSSEWSVSWRESILHSVPFLFLILFLSLFCGWQEQEHCHSGTSLRLRCFFVFLFCVSSIVLLPPCSSPPGADPPTARTFFNP